MFGIYFRLPPKEIVAVGHYSGLHQSMSAAQAVKLMLEADRGRTGLRQARVSGPNVEPGACDGSRSLSLKPRERGLRRGYRCSAVTFQRRGGLAE
jgi:hypothetical protein